MSEQTPSLEVKGIVKSSDRIVSRHRSGEEYQNMSAALKGPKNTVASIILKWRKFGTTKTLHRAGQNEQLGRRALVAEGPKNQKVTLTGSTFVLSLLLSSHLFKCC